MKTKICCSAALLCLVSQSYAQPATLDPGGPAIASPLSSQYTIIDRGPNSRTWASTVVESVAFGGTITRTNLVYELATGMHYMGTNGQWLETQESFTILPDGSGAVALQGPYQVFAPADIYDGVIAVTLPSGEVVHTRPVAISYFDGTNNVLIAELTNSIGQLAADGRSVTWPSAFTDFKADLVATYNRGSFECDLVFRAQPPDPQLLGLSENCRLQLLTETFDSPDPAVDVQTPAVTDPSSGTNAVTAVGTMDSVTLHFAGMSMPAGKAFFIGSLGNGTNSFNVRKQWIHSSGRKFILEDLSYPVIKPELSKLQASARVADQSKLLARHYSPSKELWVSAARPVRKSKARLKLARSAQKERDGFVMDYILNGSVTNFTLQSDCQYLCTGPFYVSGILTVEGGTICQFSNTPSAKISFSGPLWCRTDRYKPGIFSCQNDWTVGAPAPGASGNPAPIAATYLEDTSDADNAFRHLRFSYANRAVSITQSYTGNQIWHCQFVSCSNAVVSTSSRTVGLYNVLASGCGTVLNTCSSFSAQQVTCDQSGTFGSSIASPTASGLTNCILTGLTNLNASFVVSNCRQATSGAGIYQAVGASSYYLAQGLPDSGCHGSGTTNIHPALLADLRQLTTWPPIVFYNTTNYADLTLYPQAQHDTGIPDLGYHADPLDYVFGGFDSEANLTFAPGTAAGWFRTSSGWYHAGHGIHAGNSKVVAFNGTLEAPCYWVRYNTVQEQSTTNWAGGYGPGGITGWASTLSVSPEVHGSFLKCSVLAGEGGSGNHFRDDNGYLVVRCSNSEFWSGSLGLYVTAVYLTNSFLDRAWLSLAGGQVDTTYVVRNCTFHGGNLSINRNTTTPVSIRDTAFDGSTNNTADAYTNNTSLSDYSHNVFSTNTTGTVPIGAGVVWVTNFNWVRGPLISYNVPTNSLLVDAGSQNATNAGMYHFTTTGPKETNTIVDIGYHSVAVTSAAPATVWVDDSIPSSTIGLNNDYWTWTNSPSPYSGSYCHVSTNFSGMHQHYFYNSSVTWTLGPADTIFCYVYLNQTNLPSEVMLQWEATDASYWYHRAFWGQDGIQGWGTRTYMGPLPAAGGWVRLEVPAREVNLVGKTVNGMAFALFNATAAWDYAGQVGQRVAIDTSGATVPDYLRDSNGNGIYDPGLGEIDWQNYTSPNGLTLANGLQVFTPLK
ncbi:MAG TPA: hypothetical protein VNZ64_08400 [Candidatus Acidoferrum sp.]|jgi:hypothetical protein|nr:hypothetical protein [Candidatus Acidoferrum sp.]